jgi:hypothetical protein
LIPELETDRLVVRLAQPGMQASMAGFLSANFRGHLDRWSPPVAPDYFTAAFWAERLPVAVDDYAADRAARFVGVETERSRVVGHFLVTATTSAATAISATPTRATAARFTADLTSVDAD